jgi:hypothetical protein
MKNIIILILLILVGRYLYTNYLKKEEWSGYFYPDASNLSSWIDSDGTFDSIESCRDWVDTQLGVYVLKNPGMNINEVNYDYECGLNCRYKSGFNVCEETIQ